MIFGFMGQLFIFVGKPFYFLLSRATIALIFIFYNIGHGLIWITNKLRKIKIPKLRTKTPKIKIKFPNLQIHKPSFSWNLKIKFPNIHIKKRYWLSFVFLSTFIFLFWYLVLRGLPSPQELTTRHLDISTKIYDRNGILLYTIYKDKNRTLVNLDQVPQVVRLATLASEDAEFYSHPGFSVKGVIRALNKNIREGKLQGGSTITQQLVKNALLSSEKTYIRKLREVILAIEVELNFSKDQILEMYLNEVSYGGTAYGIQEASQFYFAKDVQDLNLSEAALLAGLPQSPTRYSPFGTNPELAFSKQREVLHLMKINKFITKEEEIEALAQPLTFAPDKTSILAPHFVMYVRQQLADTYGDDLVEKGGLNVITTLDFGIQKLAEEVVANELDKLKSLNVGNGAVLVIDPKNGDVLAMVGSKNYFDTENEGNVNVTLRPRQPGSSIKVVNYAYALSNGLSLSTFIDDNPITFNTPGSIPYTPKNYDNKFRGKITIRSALAESRNIPAVKVLASYGVSKMVEMGQKMGITTWDDPSRFGLSLTLGGGEVKLMDLARVYATIANLGTRPQIKAIKEIKNYDGETIYSESRFDITSNEQIIDSRVAYLLVDVLKDNIARAPAFGTNSMLVIRDHPEVAVKTGTSNDLRDNLTIGFNQNFVVAVWVGNNNNSPMSRVASGVTGASSIWNKIMSALLVNTESTPWQIPSGLVQSSCFGKNEWYLQENVPNCHKIEDRANLTNITSQISIEEISRKNIKRGKKTDNN